MSVTLKAYRDADGVIIKYVEGGEEELRAASDVSLTRIPAEDKIVSNDELTNETPVTVSQVTGFNAAASAAAPVQQVAGKTGNVTLVKGDVGLGNVDNTSDTDKPVSDDQQTALDLKYDASNPSNYVNAAQAGSSAPVQDVAGKTGNVVLNKNDVGLNNVDNTSDVNKPVSTATQNALNLKYDASNPNGYQTSAQVQAIVDTVIDAAPGTLDTLNELAAALGDDPNFATTITNQINDVQSNLDDHENDAANPHSVTKAQVGLGNADNTSDANKPVSTAQQTALNLKYDASNPANYVNAAGASAAAPVQSVAGKTGAVALVKADVGLGNVDNTSDLNKPVSTATQNALNLKYDASNPNGYETPAQLNTRDSNNRNRSNHTGTQLASTISNFAATVRSTVLTGLVTSTNAIITATDTLLVALGKLQAQITANLTTANNHIGSTSNPHSVTKAQVGLGNADNTSDVNKPISTATQNALNLKANSADVYTQAQLNAGQLDTRYYTETEIDAAQLIQDNAIALNTAKVSADGSVGTHNDFDLTGVATGDQFAWDGTKIAPVSILNGFTLFPIWAEESGGATNGSQQYSFGNGATGNIGIPLATDCELFAVSMQAEAFGTSISIDYEKNGVAVHTETFNGGQGTVAITAIPFVFGDLITFRTNTEVGTYSDIRVIAWFRVKANAVFPTPDRSRVTNTAVAFSATSWQNIPGMSTTVTVTDTGTVDGTVNYSAARSGGTNAEAEFRVVIDGNNGFSFPDTLSTFNDNGSSAHSVSSLPAGTYTVTAQCQTTQPITIAAIVLTAVGVED